jgi:predicted nuclease of predicted toxin-antitoxin system
VKFLVDENLPPALAVALRSAGYDATHVLDLVPKLPSDEAIWSLACEYEAVVLTKDVDFVRLIGNAHNQQAGVIWIRSGNCPRATLIAQLLDIFPDIVSRLQHRRQLIEVL